MVLILAVVVTSYTRSRCAVIKWRDFFSYLARARRTATRVSQAALIYFSWTILLLGILLTSMPRSISSQRRECYERLPRRLMTYEGQVRDYTISLIDKYIGQLYAEDRAHLSSREYRSTSIRLLVSNTLSWNIIVLDVQRAFNRTIISFNLMFE